ncbi:MAG: 2'-5' RNA ligase family protein [Planctomycetota bacterium]
MTLGLGLPMKSDNTTAVVVIPPQEAWAPIQAIRTAHDPQVRRWMPHITMLYPFRERVEFGTLEQEFTKALAKVRPIELTFARFGFFQHSPLSCTVWLAPEVTEAIDALQKKLWDVVPDCDDIRMYEHGFTPHLSVGKAGGPGAATELIRRVEANWQPLSFTVDCIHFVWREDPPDDAFRTAVTVPLAGKKPGRPKTKKD